MEQIVDFIKLHPWAKAALVGLAVASVVGVLWLAAAFAYTHLGLGEGTPYAPEAAPGEPAEEPEEEAPPPELLEPWEEADLLLPEDVRALRESYLPEVAELLATLTSNTWYAGLGDVTLRFEGTYLYESASGGEENPVPYVVTSLEAAEREVVSTDGTAYERAFALATPSGTHIATLSRQTDSIGLYWVTTLSCPLFEGSPVYTMAKASGDVAVDGPGQGWCRENGTSAEAVAQALSEFCGRNLPTVTSCTWFGTAVTDFSASTVAFRYVCDNAAATVVEAVFDQGSKTWSVRKAA